MPSCDIDFMYAAVAKWYRLMFTECPLRVWIKSLSTYLFRWTMQRHGNFYQDNRCSDRDRTRDVMHEKQDGWAQHLGAGYIRYTKQWPEIWVSLGPTEAWTLASETTRPAQFALSTEASGYNIIQEACNPDEGLFVIYLSSFGKYYSRPRIVAQIAVNLSQKCLRPTLKYTFPQVCLNKSGGCLHVSTFVRIELRDVFWPLVIGGRIGWYYVDYLMLIAGPVI
jgi:hypothetical protein